MRPLLATLVAALVLAPAAAAHVDNPKQIPFVWPAQGTITTTFGPQPDGRFHPGLDIGVLASLEVDAAAPGRVLAVGAVPGFEGYGNIVLVDVGNAVSALYAHLSAWAVEPGGEVVEGEPIATAGCTGWCTGTHLHFELRVGEEPIDPLPLLPARGG
jgi:murein DD-endopeptidase MepM/ murein hydrolase activator NlpD